MNKLILSFSAAIILFSSVVFSGGIDVQIKASINFVDLMSEVASWVQGALNRNDKNELKRITESVPRLVGQLSTIAGEKNALANYLKSYNQETSKTVFENNYRNNEKALNEQLRAIRVTINNLDPQWEGNNPMEKFNLSNAVAQKEIFLQEYGMPDNLFEINLVELANAYNNEAYNLLRSSVEISKSLQEHNNGN